MKDRTFHRGSKGKPHREIRHHKELGELSRKGNCMCNGQNPERATFKKQKTAECVWGLGCMGRFMGWNVRSLTALQSALCAIVSILDLILYVSRKHRRS